MRVESSPNYTIIEGSNKQKFLEKYLNNGANNREVALIEDINNSSAIGENRNRPDNYRNILVNFDERLTNSYDQKSDFTLLDSIINRD